METKEIDTSELPAMDKLEGFASDLKATLIAEEQKLKECEAAFYVAKGRCETLAFLIRHAESKLNANPE